MADSVKYAGDKAVIVDRHGVIQDGHHRTAYAIKHNRPVDVEMQ
jgi:hypothetical protein